MENFSYVDWKVNELDKIPVKDLPLDHLVHGDYRFVRESGKNRIRELLEAAKGNSTTSNGALREHFFVVIPLDNETYEVIDGNHRLEVFKEIGITEWPCKILTNKPDTLIYFKIAEQRNNEQGAGSVPTLEWDKILIMMKYIKTGEFDYVAPNNKTSINWNRLKKEMPKDWTIDHMKKCYTFLNHLEEKNILKDVNTFHQDEKGISVRKFDQVHIKSLSSTQLLDLVKYSCEHTIAETFQESLLLQVRGVLKNENVKEEEISQFLEKRTLTQNDVATINKLSQSKEPNKNLFEQLKKEFPITKTTRKLSNERGAGRKKREAQPIDTSEQEILADRLKEIKVIESIEPLGTVDCVAIREADSVSVLFVTYSQLEQLIITNEITNINPQIVFMVTLLREIEIIGMMTTKDYRLVELLVIGDPHKPIKTNEIMINHCSGQLLLVFSLGHLSQLSSPTLPGLKDKLFLGSRTSIPRQKKSDKYEPDTKNCLPLEFCVQLFATYRRYFGNDFTVVDAVIGTGEIALAAMCFGDYIPVCRVGTMDVIKNHITNHLFSSKEFPSEARETFLHLGHRRSSSPKNKKQRTCDPEPNLEELMKDEATKRKFLAFLDSEKKNSSK